MKYQPSREKMVIKIRFPHICSVAVGIFSSNPAKLYGAGGMFQSISFTTEFSSSAMFLEFCYSWLFILQNYSSHLDLDNLEPLNLNTSFLSEYVSYSNLTSFSTLAGVLPGEGMGELEP